MNDPQQPTKPEPWFLNDQFGFPVFRITTTDFSTGWLQGFVESIASWDNDHAKTPKSFEHYLAFIIKWDGCSHLNFGDRRPKRDDDDSFTDGYLHLCGADFYRQHVELMVALYRWADKTIPIPDHASAGHLPELAWKENS